MGKGAQGKKVWFNVLLRKALKMNPVELVVENRN